MIFKKLLTKKYGWLLLTVLFLAIIFISGQIRDKVDLTAEKRYTLSEPTQKVLDQLQTPVHVTVFLSGEMPADYKKLSNATKDLLDEFQSLSHHNIQVTFEKPGEGLDDSTKMKLYDSLTHIGVVFENNEDFSGEKDQQTSQILIPSALVTADGKKPIAVDLRSSRTVFKNYNVVNDNPEPDKEATLNAAEALLEYKFANAIDKLTRKSIPSIAYLVGNGEPIDLTVNDIGENLRNDYHLSILDLKRSFPNPKLADALLIVQPTKAFSDSDKLKLDQYVMHGGKILWFVDKLYASMDSLMRKQSDFVAYDRGLNLDDILFKYGVRINGDLLQDLNCAKVPIVVGYNPDNSPRMQRMPWPYYPFLTSDNENPISKNMDRVLSIFPSSIDTVAAPGIAKTVLLATDTNSRKLTSPALVSLHSWQDDPNFLTFNKAHLPVAVLLEGKFTSLFAHRLTPEMQDSVAANLGAPFLAENEKPTQQIVVSNAGIVLNAVMQTQGPLPMGTLPFDEYRFANKQFFLNSVDYLIGSNGLFVARNKDFILRILDRQKVADQKGLWQCINIVLPALLMVLFGFIFVSLRRKKYNH